MKESAERFKVSSWCSHLVIVDAVALCISFSNISDFVLDDVTSIVSFMLTDKFAFEGMLSMGHVRPGHQDEDFEVFQATDFISCSSDPILTFRGGECFGPEGVIV